MDNKILTLCITLVVGVILAGSMMMPILKDVTTTEKTFENTGLYYMTNPTESMHVEYLGNNEWEIDGEPLVYTLAGSTNILIFDDIFVRNNGQVRGSTNANWDAADITVSNGTVTGTQTISGSTTSVSWTYETSFIAVSEKADWIMKAYSDTSYIKSDSAIIGKGLTQVKNNEGTNTLITCYVDVTDLTPTVTTTNTNVTISDVALNVEEVDGYEDLYKFTSVTFKATWGTYVTDCTYNVVIVPSEVTAELSQHLNPGEISLINVLPVLVIVALLLAAVGAVVIRRNE